MEIRKLRSAICLACLVSVMIFCTGVVLAEVPVKDIPPDHPAYKAVQGLIEKGYLGLYQDGTFQGGHAVDRYTLATVVGKVLTDIQNGRLVLPAEEMKTLRQLATEFRAELVELAGRVNAQGQAQEKLGSDVTILREDGTRMLGEIYTMQGRVDKMAGDLGKLATDDNELRQAVSSLEGRTQENAQAIAALGARTDNLERLTAGQVADLARSKSLEAAYAELRTEFDSYRRSTEAEVEQLKTTNKWLIGGLAALGLIAVSR